MLDSEWRASGGIEKRTASGEIRVWFPTPDIVASEASGKLDMELARTLMQAISRIIAHGIRPHCIHDWQRVTGYDSDARTEMTAWMVRVRASVASVSLLVESKLVAMGISVANVALGGGLITMTDRGKFEAYYRRKVADRRQKQA